MKDEDNKTSNEIGEMKRFSRRDALRVFGGAGLGMFLTSLANPVSIAGQTKEKQAVKIPAQKDNLQGAGFYRFKVGDLECVAVSDGEIFIKPEEFFDSAPKTELEQILRDNFLPTAQITLSINTLIVKSGGKTVLMDTGAGKNIGPTGGFFHENLQRAGINPATITDIVYSHSHLDHIGGNFGANKKIYFPNARFHIAQKEWDEAIKKTDYFGGRKVDPGLSKVVFDAIDKDLAPLKNRISFFTSDTKIAPGVIAMPTPGHTPGHTIYEVKSGAETLLFVGDLIHHAAIQFARPAITMFGDSYPSEAAAARKKILERVARERLLMMGAHLPYPGIGHIRARDEKGASYEWIPIEWQWQA